MVSDVKHSPPALTLTPDQLEFLAIYNLAVPYPPAPERPFNNELSIRAKKGFELFHVEGDKNPKSHILNLPSPNVCGNCHRMPFLTSTNTPGQGMDAPTWRGAYDRHLLLPQGRMNIIDFPWIKEIANGGRDEFKMWRLSWSGDQGPRTAFDPVWSMVLEGSTGFSGAFARQVTLDKKTARSQNSLNLWSELELAAKQGMVVLECEGVFIAKDEGRRARLQFIPGDLADAYFEKASDYAAYSKDELLRFAKEGRFVGTLIARHGAKSDFFTNPQPALWTLGPLPFQGKQFFPIVDPYSKTIAFSGAYFFEDALIFVDGKATTGTISRKKGNDVVLTLNTMPSKGMHLLQVQVPQGQMSNDFIFYVK